MLPTRVSTYKRSDQDLCRRNGYNASPPPIAATLLPDRLNAPTLMIAMPSERIGWPCSGCYSIIEVDAFVLGMCRRLEQGGSRMSR